MSDVQMTAIASCGRASRALPGESTTGDRHVISPVAGGLLIAVIDGLGHGIEAARAADRAAQIVQSARSDDLEQIVTSCHHALRSSRGAVMTVLFVNPSEDVLSYIAVGNVVGMVVHRQPLHNEEKQTFMLLRGGVVGHVLPNLHTSRVRIERGDTIILATDGIGFEFATDRGLLQTPQRLAERLLDRYAVESDDALVLAARYLGGGGP